MNPFDKQQINPSESSSRYVELEEGGKSSITPESKLQRPNLCLKIILGASCLVLAIVILSFSLLMYEQNLELGDVQSFPDSAKLTISVIAWNLQILGTTKLNNRMKMEGINNIIKSYDIIMLSELMQSVCDNNDACEMKNYFKQNYPEHDFYMSPSLGFNEENNRNKEQYGFLIRKTLNYQKELYYYPDPQGIFARKPYYIYIKEYNLYLAIVHTTPWSNTNFGPAGTKTIQEVIELSRFFNSVTGDMILMGDLNLCDPSVLNNEEDIRKNFQWILNNSEMTNLASKQCAYDRIITRKDFSRYLDPKVIRDSNVKDLGLSDHYPISILVS
jgi:endonuclease/exonuclease/phosphatase family metal-dependent hydrolase